MIRYDSSQTGSDRRQPSADWRRRGTSYVVLLNLQLSREVTKDGVRRSSILLGQKARTFDL